MSTRLIATVPVRGVPVRVAVDPAERRVVVHRDGASDALVLDGREVDDVIAALLDARRCFARTADARGERFARQAGREAVRAGKERR